jgi:hypothetical protein
MSSGPAIGAHSWQPPMRRNSSLGTGPNAMNIASIGSSKLVPVNDWYSDTYPYALPV